MLRKSGKRGIRVLDIDSLVLQQQNTTHELSFWESKLLALQKFFKKNASTSFIASFLHRMEITLFCNMNNANPLEETTSIECLSDDFFLIVATKKSFDELKKTPAFQRIVGHITPEYLLINGSDTFEEKRFNDFLRALGNKTTQVLAAKSTANDRAFLYPLLMWAEDHGISPRKIVLVSDDQPLCKTAKECNVGTRTALWFSLFACPVT
jgi:hypothetical protein